MSFIPKTAFRFAIPVFALCMMVLLTASVTKAGEIYTSGWSGAAIDGTDPVAYFTDGRAVEGSKIFTMKWRGATWRFASAENLATFKAAPEKYAPQYGGYCAWAVSQGYSAKIDPDAWKIVDGKLYLNYSKGVQRRWQQDMAGNIAKGDANWPKVRAGLN